MTQPRERGTSRMYITLFPRCWCMLVPIHGVLWQGCHWICTDCMVRFVKVGVSTNHRGVSNRLRGF